MVEHHLETPITEDMVRKLRKGDIAYVTGKMFTARDAAHKRALEYKRLPFDLEGRVLYHCGPVVRKVGDHWEVVAAGPTTSYRMEAFQADFMRSFGVRFIIGKGGMGAKTTEAMIEYGGAYGAYTGGVAALAAKMIKGVERVEWLDLGLGEALWFLNVEEFGPLIVSIDADGNNLFDEVLKNVDDNRRKIYTELGLEIEG